MSAITKVYWRSIQRGSRTFAAVPEELRQDVKTLARRDAEAGKISAEAYRQYIGEPYAEEHTEE